MSKKESIPLGPMRFAFFVSKPYRKWAIWALIFVVFAASISTLGAYVVRGLIDSANFSAQNIDQGTKTVLWWVLAYAGFEFCRALLYRLSGFNGMHWITGVEARSYGKLFEYMSRHSQSFFDDRFAGSLVNHLFTAARSTSANIETILWTYLPVFIRFIVSIILIYTTNVWIALVFALWVLILLPLNYQLAKRQKGLSETEAGLSSELRGKSVDATSNISAIHQYSQRGWEIKKMNQAIHDYRDAGLKTWKFAEWSLLTNNIILAAFTVSTLVMTFFFWRQGFITVGVFIMIIALVVEMIDNLTFIGQNMNRFAKNYGEINKSLQEILIPHAILDKKNAENLTASQGQISIENISFDYNIKGRDVMANLNLNIEPAQRVGIVGTSGAGKTTLIKLILRQHEVSSGSIKIDGQNINDVTLDSLRESIGIVPQEPLLFHRSVRENIAYGNLDASDKEIEEAAKLAQAHSFIQTLPDGYNTLVGERGVKLSAGQRQRIAIARAILKNAKILILDEATSALDSESEVAIQKALTELMKGKTVLAVAHRLSTLSEMDRIIVLRDGKIVEDGTHQELLENQGGLYAKLWAHQAGGFIEG
ncbi:ABC transporter ATP-binding protein [Candidatus Nomurabacteria bacterium]|nr:ABC transporter ATP-binding protein [Candidatus Nomurabacteria bacterium]